MNSGDFKLAAMSVVGWSVFAAVEKIQEAVISRLINVAPTSLDLVLQDTPYPMKTISVVAGVLAAGWCTSKLDKMMPR